MQKGKPLVQAAFPFFLFSSYFWILHVFCITKTAKMRRDIFFTIIFIKTGRTG